MSFLETPAQGALDSEAPTDARPENVAQRVENIDSGPGFEAISAIGPELVASQTSP